MPIGFTGIPTFLPSTAFDIHGALERRHRLSPRRLLAQTWDEFGRDIWTTRRCWLSFVESLFPCSLSFLNRSYADRLFCAFFVRRTIGKTVSQPSRCASTFLLFLLRLLPFRLPHHRDSFLPDIVLPLPLCRIRTIPCNLGIQEQRGGPQNPRV